MSDSTFIQFQATHEVKELLAQISAQDGERNKSLTIRRLIRDEAKRRGIETVSQNDQPQPITSQ